MFIAVPLMAEQKKNYPINNTSQEFYFKYREHLFFELNKSQAKHSSNFRNGNYQYVLQKPSTIQNGNWKNED